MMLWVKVCSVGWSSSFVSDLIIPGFHSFFFYWMTYLHFFFLFLLVCSAICWIQIQMICLCGVCLELTLSLYFTWFCFHLFIITKDTLFFSQGYVGELHPDKNSDSGKHVLYTHKNIIVKYNNDQVKSYLDILLYLIGVFWILEVSCLCLFPCRSFMLISLRISQSLWRLENIWIWHILSNGFLLMSLLGAALMSTWTILSLSIRYNLFFLIMVS